ncbi:MAG: T9SS type A sorting domain-containing protein [Janthinobacterium lividum]
MKSLVRLLALLTLLLAGPLAEATTVTITVGDNFYSPQLVTIRPGDIIKWQYQGGTNSHPTASDNAAWTTFTINSANVTNSIPFNTAGSFPYHCTFHGGVGVGMYGIITVATALPTTAAQLTTAAFQAYPNPAHDVVTLKLDRAQLHDAATAQLVDMLGRVVQTLEISPAATSPDLTVSVADLPTGLYIYRLLVGREVLATQRLTLTR